MDTQNSYERGGLNPLILIVVVLSIVVVGLAGFGIWAYINYGDAKTNLDDKINAAVADAKRAQSATDEAQFAEREKQPTKQFVGPDDLGRVSFLFPKTWSGYVDKLGTSSSNYEAYFQPGTVPPLDSGTPYALRITILNKSYEDTLAGFQEKVKKGDVHTTTATIDGQTGSRLDGKIETNIDGVMVLLKLRDKTLEVYTESRTFQPDFDNTILSSLKFNS